MNDKIFYSPNIREFTPDIIPEIRIKLWVSNNTDNQQIEEVTRRLYKTLKQEGFASDPNDPNRLTHMISVHAIDDPDGHLVEELEDDPTTVFVYWGNW